MAVSPEELARAICQGLEERRTSAITHEPDNFTDDLIVAANLNAVVLSLPTGIKGRVSNILQRVLRKLLRPWLNQQMHYNNMSAKVIRSYQVTLHEQHQQILKLMQRLDECMFELSRLRDKV